MILYKPNSQEACCENSIDVISFQRTWTWKLGPHIICTLLALKVYLGNEWKWLWIQGTITFTSRQTRKTIITILGTFSSPNPLQILSPIFHAKAGEREGVLRQYEFQTWVSFQQLFYLNLTATPKKVGITIPNFTCRMVSDDNLLKVT